MKKILHKFKENLGIVFGCAMLTVFVGGLWLGNCDNTINDQISATKDHLDRSAHPGSVMMPLPLNTYEYCITNFNIFADDDPIWVVHPPNEPDWELVGFAATDKKLYWTWRREHKDN